MPIGELVNYRFAAILDGFSWARNTMRTLALDMVPFRAETGLQWWYYEGLRPWREYVPLENGLTNLDIREKVLWARREDEAARRVAQASTVFAERWFPERMQLAY